MSEKSKGDTSPSMIPAPSRVVKNPLLSASVTGLTFEDFPNKPLLLPAAPPVHVSTAASPASVLGLGIMNREPKSLVTVGQTSNIDRDETLSEINLSSSADETQPSAQIDTNSNSLLEQNPNTDSILSQAASSFSALPSVASSVFSTFSKRIYSAGSSRERTPFTEERDANANPISELDIQPPYTQHHQAQNQYYSTPPPQQFITSTELSPSFVAPPPFAGENNNIGATPAALTGSPPSTQSHCLNNEPPAEPPKLYTPAEVPTLSTASVAAPPPAGGQNTYRLTTKKKTYAPIPGFSDATYQHQAAHTVDPSAISAPISAHTQAIPYSNPQLNLYGPTPPGQQLQSFQPKTEERKGGIFSITNLVSTGVLQNISGLVQSAAGTIAQSVKPDSTYQSPISSQHQQQNQEQTSFDINYVGSASLGSNFYPSQPPPVATTQNFFATQPYPTKVQSEVSTESFCTTPYPTGAQQKQVGLPALPVQTKFLAPTSDKISTENPIVPVSTQLGFEPFLGDSIPANSQTTLQASLNAADAEAKSQDTKLLSATETPLSQLQNKIPLFDPPKQTAVPFHTVGSASVTTVSPAESLSAPVPPTVVPSQIPFFDPIRSSVQPVAASTTNLISNNSFHPFSSPTQQDSTATTNLTSSTFFEQTRPPSHPVHGGTTNSTATTFFAPNRQPSQPAPAAVSTNLIWAPSHPLPATLTTPINIFDPTRPPSQASAAEVIQKQPSHPSAPLVPQIPAAATSNIFTSPHTPTQQLPPPTSVGQPPAASGPSSFRLQKGTRLYKNPLTSAETVPATYLNQPLQQPSLVQPSPQALHITPQSIFNPFASTVASEEHSPALFVPESLPPKQLKEDTPADKQSPALFVPETPPSKELKEVSQPSKSQPIDFFNPDPAPLSDLTAQANIISNTERPTEPLSTFSNSPIQLQFTGSQAIDHFLPQSLQSAEEPGLVNNSSILETDSQQSTAEFDLIKSKTANIDASESTSSILHSKQQLTENPKQQESIKDKTSNPLQQIQQQETETSSTHAAFQAANFLPPPPQLTALQGVANPYRKEHTETHAATTGTQPSLANFFTPIESDCSTDFNFFSTPLKTAESFDPISSTSAVLSKPKEISENTSTNSTNFFQLQTPNAPSPSPQLTPTHTPSPKLTETPTTTPRTNFNAESCGFPQLPPHTCIAPPPLFKEAPEDFVESPALVQHPSIAPPLGFDNLIAAASSSPLQIAGNVDETQSQGISTATTTQQAPNLHSVSNFFNKTSSLSNFEKNITTAKEPERNLPDPTSFFDTFAPAATVFSQPTTTYRTQATKQQQTNEDQRIQNFFNNPPPQELGGSVGDLNYDLVHGGLVVKNLQTRSLTPASILVEPPSSSCSEFSELNSSLQGQRQNISADNSNRISPEEQNKTQPIVEAAVSATTKEVETIATVVNDTTQHYEDLPAEILQELRMANLLIGEKGAATAPPTTVSTYSPAVKHWFFKRILSNKTYWTPFSHYDSALLETTLVVGDSATNIVAVEGGRYDVNIRERTKTPVYWEGKPIEVRRCSWFYKATDSRYVPYEEETAEQLEAEYKLAAEKGEWHKKIIVSMGEQVVFHGPTVIVHFQQQQNIDAWGGSSQTTTRPRVVKRDLEDFIIEQGESQRVDHLLLMVHGIGSACDLKMRSVEEVVDDFRSIAQQLVSSHYKNSTEMGLVGRVEILPISWHSHLHSEEMGIDEKLKSITLESIPKLRNFANDTLLDVLFYTSPTYCQKIMNTVASSMNSVYSKYRQRHPEFSGGVSVAGHSLGSLILFDMLCHQHPIKEIEEENNMENPDQEFATSPTTSNGEQNPPKQISYTMGIAGTGQPFIHYEQLLFQPKKFFAMGSPIGVFVTIRGIDNLGLAFRLPTCAGFYNIFHPFDPVAYRIEALVNPDMNGIRPVLIPHHKGRKRMHLELRETMTRVGADLKQRFMDTFKTTLETVNFLGSTSTSRGNKENEAKETMEKEVDKVLKMQLDLDQPDVEQLLTDEQKTLSNTRLRTDSASTSFSDTDIVEIDFPLGKLNDSKRIDYVLQEAPLEFFNEYLFALSSHVCYWESEDTILFVMKEIYTGLGVSPDSQVPQQSMTIERPSTRNSQHIDAAQDQAATPT